jgi:hypothetical protein
VHIFNYALIRLVPFAHRGEMVNVGLVVFKPDSVDVRLSASPNMLAYFNVNSRAVEWISNHIKEMDDPTADPNDRVARLSLATGYTLSELGWFAIDVNNQYEHRISDIISEYIDRPKRQTTPRKQSNLLKNLRNTFKEYDIYSSDIHDVSRHRVVPNMPVGPSGKLRIDFILKNSVYHATETLDFSSSENSGPSEIKNAALASVTFQHAKESWSNIGVRCYLVYSAPTIVEKAVEPALKIAAREAIDSFNLESRDEKLRYIDIMLAAADHRSMLQ